MNGIECTANDYHVDNSITGYNGTTSTKTTNNQNSCLKFYAFNYDEGDERVNLLLDHNTTSTTFWTNASTTSNVNGPIKILTQLQKDTNEWVGTQMLEDYQVIQNYINYEEVEVNVNYTIDYNNEDDSLDYKARLITADEIAEIIGADKKEGLMFNERTTSGYSSFYFDSLTSSASLTCTEGNTTGCGYGWLYDRTSSSCTTYGCLNNATGPNSTSGYWTATAAFGISRYAWCVNDDGHLFGYSIDSSYDGVRPVIEVLKSNN